MKGTFRAKLKKPAFLSHIGLRTLLVLQRRW